MTPETVTRSARAWALALVLVLCGCGNDPPKSHPSGSAAASALASCPNPDGGFCAGRLGPDKTYTTEDFTPAITYAVPTSGWDNLEDLYGNFLLVPPGNDLDGVNAGTSDYIGVYRAVLPSKLAGPQCRTTWPLGSLPGPTPREMVSYYRTQHNLTVSNVRTAAVGGRSGIVLDLRARPGVPLDHCRDGDVDVHVDSVIAGVDGSSLDHGVAGDMTMRLYLLRDQERVLAVEVDDIPAAPGTLDTLDRVVEGLRFAAPPAT